MEAWQASFWAGAAGGIIGHTPDTLKVHAQAHQHPSWWRALQSIRKESGWLGLWRGVSVPVLSRALNSSATFAAYQAARPHVADSRIVAGGVAGLVSGVLATPLELAKIRLQTGRRVFNTGSYWIGWQVTVLRNVGFFAVYFAVHDVAKAAGWWMPGGWAGCAGWALTFPLDTYKSYVQATDYAGGVRPWLQRVGVRGLYRGLGPALCRAFPVHYTTLAVYDRLVGT